MSFALRTFKAALAVAVLASAPLAHGQIFRAYLALDGVDTNPCTLAQPCRLLPAAVAAVGAGGEIWMLDSANFNVAPVTVNKSVVILSIPGQLGSLVALGGPALTITGAGVEVTLRNLNILPFTGNALQNGVVVNASSGKVVLQNCNLFGFTGGRGLHVQSTTRVTIMDSVFTGNLIGAELGPGSTTQVSGSRFVGNSEYGVLVLSQASAMTQASVTRSVFTHNQTGASAQSYDTTATARLHVADSVAEHSTQYGLYAHSDPPGSIAHVVALGNLIGNNGYGLATYGSAAKIMAGGNAITNNNIAFLMANTGVIESQGNNLVRSNGGGETVTTTFGGI